MAWRSWNLLGNYLISTSHPTSWSGPVLHADVPPRRDNTHGIYAVKALINAPLTVVWGEVALSGIVVEGEDGYRAEVATIRSLFVGRRQDALEPDGYHAGHTFVEWPDAALCAALEERYKVEVVVVAPRLTDQSLQGLYSQQARQNQQALQNFIYQAAAQTPQVYMPGVHFVSSGSSQQIGFGGYGNI